MILDFLGKTFLSCIWRN